MSAPFKVKAQAQSKGEKLKAGKSKHGSKTKPRKAAAKTSKAKGKPQPQQKSSNGDLQTHEKIEREPEPVGEDDHAFFDEEENANYAKFMLSLDSAGLTTFSKRAKDRVAVPPTSKKKAKQPKPQPSEQQASSEPSTEAATASAPDGTPAATDSASPVSVEVPLPVAVTTVAAVRPAKEAMIDAKRRKASTTGWVVEDSGPERLPIKTRRGVLKPNARMQPQTAAPAAEKYIAEGETVSGGTGDDGEQPTAAGEKGAATVAVVQGGDSGNSRDEDMMSDGEASVYDSADSEAEDYTMGEFNDTGGGERADDGRGGASTDINLAVLKQRRFEQKKALMAELCEAILGAPEESLVRPKSGTKGEDEPPRMEQLSALVSVVTLSPLVPLLPPLWCYRCFSCSLQLYSSWHGSGRPE